LRYGRGKCITTVSQKAFLTRGVIPFATLIALMILFVFKSFWCPELIPYIVMGILAIVLAEATRTVFANRKKIRTEIWRGKPDEIPNIFGLIPLVALCFMAMNLGHAFGFAYQLARMGCKRKIVW
jgi:hypothetical protein